MRVWSQSAELVIQALGDLSLGAGAPGLAGSAVRRPDICVHTRQRCDSRYLLVGRDVSSRATHKTLKAVSSPTYVCLCFVVSERANATRTHTSGNSGLKKNGRLDVRAFGSASYLCSVNAPHDDSVRGLKLQSCSGEGTAGCKLLLF